MALQINYNFHGLTVPNAYIRVENITWNIGGHLSAVAVVYATPESVNAITSFQVNDVEIDAATAESVGNAVYAALKMLPEFSSASDNATSDYAT